MLQQIFFFGVGSPVAVHYCPGVKPADLVFEQGHFVKVHVPGRELAQLGVSDKEDTVPGHKHEKGIFRVGRFGIAELHPYAAQVDGPVPLQFFVRRDNFERDAARILPDDAGIALEEFLSVSRIFFQTLSDLQKMAVGLRAGYGPAVHRMHAVGMVPVPVGDHGQIRERQAFPVQSFIKVLNMGGGMPRIYGKRHFFSAHITQVGTVLAGILGKNPCICAELLQMIFHGHLTTSGFY